MKKIVRYLSLLAVVLALLSVLPFFTSCSAGKDHNDVDIEIAPEKGETSDGVSYAPGTPTTDGADKVDTPRKIIRTFTVLGETKEYDKAVSSINDSISAHNGYVSESKVTGISYSSSSKYSREAYFVIKIPAENLDSFISQVGGLLNVTSSSSTQDDVSEAYYSIEARMKTLETERESLLSMMASLDTSKDYNFWLSLRNQISEIEQQIAEYKAIIKSYDNKVTYSTVNLTVRDVVEYTPVEDKDPSFFDRIAAAFVESWTEFGEGCMDFAVFIVRAFPTLLVFPGIPAIIVVIVIVVNKKKKKKEETK